VTTYRHLNDMQESQAPMLVSTVGTSLEGCVSYQCACVRRERRDWWSVLFSCRQGVEATLVNDHPGFLTSTSKVEEEISTSIGHLPDGCCSWMAERGSGIGQLESQELLRPGVAEYITFQASESDFGRTFMSAAGDVQGAVELMVSECCCKPAEQGWYWREQVPSWE